MEDLRQSRTEQLRQAQLRAFREQGIKTEEYSSTRTIVLTASVARVKCRVGFATAKPTYFCRSQTVHSVN